jgi:hypothetical protein
MGRASMAHGVEVRVPFVDAIAAASIMPDNRTTNRRARSSKRDKVPQSNDYNPAGRGWR